VLLPSYSSQAEKGIVLFCCSWIWKILHSTTNHKSGCLWG